MGNELHKWSGGSRESLEGARHGAYCRFKFVATLQSLPGPAPDQHYQQTPCWHKSGPGLDPGRGANPSQTKENIPCFPPHLNTARSVMNSTGRPLAVLAANVLSNTRFTNLRVRPSCRTTSLPPSTATWREDGKAGSTTSLIFVLHYVADYMQLLILTPNQHLTILHCHREEEH